MREYFQFGFVCFGQRMLALNMLLNVNEIDYRGLFGNVKAEQLLKG